MRHFAVCLHIPSIYSDKAACFALHPIQRRPKLLNWPCWLLWKFYCTWIEGRQWQEMVHYLTPHCYWCLVLFSQVPIKIDDCCAVLLANQHTVLFKKAKDSVAVIF